MNAFVKKNISFLIFSFVIGCSVTFSQTQADMNKQTYESYKKADKELNDIYHKILIEYKADTLFVKNLKASQRIWINFRDAELKIRYPDYGNNYYGSMQPMCVASYLEKLTKERIKTLKEWLDGVEEGEGCEGSVKLKK